jgi:hypothetical protein
LYSGAVKGEYPRTDDLPSSRMMSPLPQFEQLWLRGFCNDQPKYCLPHFGHLPSITLLNSITQIVSVYR